MKNTLSRLSLGKLFHRLKHDRGAVLVEAAICIPLLLLVILGAVEAGLAWEAKSATVSGVRTGTLRAASDADNPSVDFRILQSVIGEVGGENFDRIESISIFEVTGNADADFASCLSSGSGNCIVYDAADISAVVNGTLTAADFGNGVGTTDPITGELDNFTCDAGHVDSGWCSGERIDDGDVQLAVGIEYTHDWFTGIFPFDSPTFTEYVTSATFTDGGVDINPGAPVATPFASALISNFTFDTDPNSAFGSNIVFNNFDPVDSSQSGFGGPGIGGPTNTPVTSSISLSGLDPTTPVCASFSLYVFGDVESADTYSASAIGATNDTDNYSFSDGGPTTVNGMQAHIQHGNTVCAMPNADGTAQIAFTGQVSWTDEGWGIDNLSIAQ